MAFGVCNKHMLIIIGRQQRPESVTYETGLCVNKQITCLFMGFRLHRVAGSLPRSTASLTSSHYEHMLSFICPVPRFPAVCAAS